MSARRALRARYVFPVSGPPIADGVVVVEGGRIAGVGNAASLAGSPDIEDLGNAAILPGLVNAHTHLEFSDLKAPLGEPGMGMVSWIRLVMAFRREARPDMAERVEMGFQESLRHGTAVLGEIAQSGWPVEAFQSLPIHCTVFVELIGPTPERAAQSLELARQHVQSSRHTPCAGQSGTPTTQAWCPVPTTLFGLSPHAPYSVHPELLRAAINLSAAHRIPLAFHLAESRDEMELLRTGGGPFEELLQELNAWDPTTIPPAIRPLDYLRMLAQADRALVIHGNYLDNEEIALLASHADRMAIVYCPRTHAWFGHKPYPLEKMLAAGALVALGTDSRASSPDLSILAEMRHVARYHPAVPGNVILELGAIRGARALGCDRDYGSLEPGKRAHLAVVALPDRDASDPHELLFDSDARVTTVYAGGEPALTHPGG